MDRIRGIEDFVRQVESAIRNKLEAPSKMSGHHLASFLDTHHQGVLDPDEVGSDPATYLFSGVRSWPLCIVDERVEGTFQVGFGVIRQLTTYSPQESNSPRREVYLLGHPINLAHAPSTALLAPPRGYLRVDYDSNRGYGEKRLYLTDAELTVFNRLLHQGQGLRNDDAPEGFRLPGEDPPPPKFPEETPIELRRGIEEIVTYLKANLRSLSKYPQSGAEKLLAGR